MDYTPKQDTQQLPTPSYELKKDVTGEAPEKRGPQIVTDKNGVAITLPYPPKKDCKKCYGRGYSGTNVVNGRLIICRKCYPRV